MRKSIQSVNFQSRSRSNLKEIIKNDISPKEEHVFIASVCRYGSFPKDFQIKPQNN